MDWMFLGAVGLTVNNAEIKEYDYGVYWNGLEQPIIEALLL